MLIEERKFCQLKLLSREGHLKKLVYALPYNPDQGLLLPEILQTTVSDRALHLALHMHLHFTIACSIVEAGSTVEPTRISEIFQRCHHSFLCLIDLFNRSLDKPDARLC